MAITSVLEGGSALNDQIAMGHVVAGNITTGAGASAVLTCNDRTAVLTRTGTGDYTITFGDAFLAAPVITFTPTLATFATSESWQVQIISQSTTAVRFNMVKISYTGVAATILASVVDQAAADSVNFIAVGKRYN